MTNKISNEDLDGWIKGLNCKMSELNQRMNSLSRQVIYYRNLCHEMIFTLEAMGTSMDLNNQIIDLFKRRIYQKIKSRP